MCFWQPINPISLATSQNTSGDFDPEEQQSYITELVRQIQCVMVFDLVSLCTDPAHCFGCCISFLKCPRESQQPHKSHLRRVKGVGFWFCAWFKVGVEGNKLENRSTYDVILRSISTLYFFVLEYPGLFKKSTIKYHVFHASVIILSSSHESQYDIIQLEYWNDSCKYLSTATLNII